MTTADATAVLDSYHLEKATYYDVPGFRSDPTQGATSRILQFEYEGDISEPLLFRFFSPDRLKEAIVGTGWEISDVRPHPSHPEAVVQHRDG